SVPKKILYPMIFTVSIIGSFAVRYSFFDIVACLGFGIFGWILRKHNYPVAPIVLGIVLGNIAETNFRRAVMMGDYSIFFTRPASLILLLLALVSFAWPIIQNRIYSKKELSKLKN
ncbi:MAG: tripartite tricarboxylate transporter permease, partial [Candidatus Cloacimonadota bacterium]|nr:tripartite tricarboxylate transporter permease [Candidatus Cloacimonadota bacterium]